MKLYVGTRVPHRAVTVIDTALSQRHPLVHSVHHSPTGLEWGYPGSGPADCARSILCDFLGISSMTPRMQDQSGLINHWPVSYQDFKNAVIAQLPPTDFVIPEPDIAVWIISEAAKVDWTKLVLPELRYLIGISGLRLFPGQIPEEFKEHYRPSFTPFSLVRSAWIS